MGAPSLTVEFFVLVEGAWEMASSVIGVTIIPIRKYLIEEDHGLVVGGFSAIVWQEAQTGGGAIDRVVNLSAQRRSSDCLSDSERQRGSSRDENVVNL